MYSRDGRPLLGFRSSLPIAGMTFHNHHRWSFVIHFVYPIWTSCVPAMTLTFVWVAPTPRLSNILNFIGIYGNIYTWHQNILACLHRREIEIYILLLIVKATKYVLTLQRQEMLCRYITHLMSLSVILDTQPDSFMIITIGNLARHIKVWISRKHPHLTKRCRKKVGEMLTIIITGSIHYVATFRSVRTGHHYPFPNVF